MVFEQVAQKLAELGFYDFLLPFILTATLTYAILKKTKILGESPLISGILSLSLGFIIFGLPQLMGVSLAKPLTSFFTQTIVAILIITIGFLIAGFFYPNIFEKMMETVKGGGMVWWFIIFAIILAITSGLFGFITSPIMKVVGGGRDVFIGIFFLLIFIVVLAIITGGKKD